MRRRQLVDQGLALRSEGEENFSPIRLGRGALDQTAFHQSVDQPHRAVVAKKEALGQFPNREAALVRRPFDREQRLVLLRRKSRAPRGFRAEMKKSAESMTKGRERDVVIAGNPAGSFGGAAHAVMLRRPVGESME